ncbi:MAG: undecaprenyl/decaprenyl-phosphate alpha-N-acetylglucosaminyl 1-phosphate transferase [Acetobacteraceae bacterium]|nr:undecaprenyl/decaprenyl-phosphate alpha-N-acetylglucosaminyl 1-phosphate transferase [Acetobacteraceae bacterium]
MTSAALLRHMALGLGLALLSAIVVRIMISLRVMDTPDARKAHDRPTPKGGGVGVVAAFLVGSLLLYRYAEFARLADEYFLGVIAASAAIALVAFLDDLYDWPFGVKLGIQGLAALVAVGTGIYVHNYSIPFIGPVYIGWIGIPVTLVWLLFTTNAVNFIDGLNGLASGVTLIACAFLAFIAAGVGGAFCYAACGLLGAGLLGFLPFNFPRARIFMGDVGSQFCGFMIAVLGVVASRFEGVALSFMLVPMLLSGVLFDAGFTLLRRALAGERLTQSHRGHLYQVAHRSGVPAVTVTLIHWGFAIFGGLACLVFLRVSPGWKAAVPFVTLPPQLAWLAFVVWIARRNPPGRWG